MVTLSLEIDADLYANAYGIAPSEVRNDVKAVAAQAVFDQLVRVTGQEPSVKVVTR